jgi:hypothetical protein
MNNLDYIYIFKNKSYKYISYKLDYGCYIETSKKILTSWHLLSTPTISLGSTKTKVIVVVAPIGLQPLKH